VLPLMQIAETDTHAPTANTATPRVLYSDTGSFEVLMRRYNRRVIRAARAVLRDEGEAEDVVQDAWVRAYTHLRQFSGRASFATWLTRIAFHESLARRRYRVRHLPLDEHAAALPAATRPPEQEVGARQVASALEAAIDALPARYRMAFVLRDLEGLGTAETAACLEVPEATVKTRLHRARALLRSHLDAMLGVSADGVYAFGGRRCDRVVGAVMARIAGARTSHVAAP
jgi:RNA polymerase sigma-70 factor, ECF subfamily